MAGKFYAKKQAYLDEVMGLLEGTYTRKSGVFLSVEKALQKLSRDELGNLYAMLLCEVKPKSKVTFKVKRNPTYGEYEVEVFENGKKNPERSYFTDGREDAYDTMEAMKKEEEKNEN